MREIERGGGGEEEAKGAERQRQMERGRERERVIEGERDRERWIRRQTIWSQKMFSQSFV